MRRALASTTASFATAVLLALALGGTALAQSATVMTDQSDYAPGQIVTITGSGWQAGETVTLNFVESPLIDTHPDLTAVADANGNIFNNQFSPDSHDVNVTFTLTATGGTSGLQAQTTFTDASHIQSVVVGAQSPSPVTAGGSATYPISFTHNGSGADSVTLNISSWTGGVPTGVSACSSSPSSCFSPNPVDVTGTSTLTITTTASTPPGTYTFTVQAVADATKTATGTLFVIGPPSKLVFTSTAVAVTVGACSSALTVQSQDSAGNPSNVSSTETLAPSANPSAGASFYTDNACTTAVTGSNLTIPSGSNSASFFFKDTAPGSVLITVTGTGAFTANGANAATQTETVNAATARRGQVIIASLVRKDRYTVVALQ